MGFGLLDGAMLFGLLALGVPPLLHLLRRRHALIDWGAMRFLPAHDRPRRRLIPEELLLLLLRLAIVALLVLALASPRVWGPIPRSLGLEENRDRVVILDGSLAMSFVGDDGRTSQDHALAWIGALAERMAPGDTLGLVQVRELPVTLLEPTADLQAVRDALAAVPAPAGRSDGPAALETALRLLANARPGRDVVMVAGGGREGWTDERAISHWHSLAGTRDGPRIWLSRPGPELPADPPNWAVKAPRPTALSTRSTVRLQAGLVAHGNGVKAPSRISFVVDEGKAEALPTVPHEGTTALTWTQRFTAPGSHLVRLAPIDGDPGPRFDRFRGDNERSCAVTLSLLPVLLADGLPPGDRPRGSDFLRTAIDPPGDPDRLTRTRRVALEDLADLLQRDVGPEGATPPQVVVLCDVPRLTTGQREALDRFVRAGGGLLVTVGPRADAAHYNRDLFRDGAGWLPAALEMPAGDENALASAASDPAARPLPASFDHPALQDFRAVAGGGLANARFPRWWRLRPPDTDGSDAVIADLTTRTPWLVERRHGKGRVILAAVPFDDSWGTNLHRVEVPEFPLLARRLVAYLAAGLTIEHNLRPGQPLVFIPGPGDRNKSDPRCQLVTPRGETHYLEPSEGVYLHSDTRLPGVYLLTTPRNRVVHYVVQPEDVASPTPWAEGDRARFENALPIRIVADSEEILVGDGADVWWLMLLGMAGLLMMEIWLTRRMAGGAGR